MIKTLKTGDIIRARVRSMPFIFHLGIIVEEPDGLYVYHNSPDYVNENGGNVLKTKLDEWLKERTITVVIHTNMPKEQIEEAVTKLSYQKYNCFNNNCETFISQIRFGIKSSPQATWFIYAIGLVAVSALVYVTVFKNKKWK